MLLVGDLYVWNIFFVDDVVIEGICVFLYVLFLCEVVFVVCVVYIRWLSIIVDED